MLRLMGCWITLVLTGCATVSHPQSAERTIALSFDDVPRSKGAFFSPDERARRIITQLEKARVEQAVFFVTPGNLAKPDGAGGEKRIDQYVQAGHVIANHSFSHKHLTAGSAAEYIADIDRAERWLRGRAGYRPWFRFPFLNEGRRDKAKRDAVRKALKSRGMQNAYVTSDGADWNLEALTINAAKEGRALDMRALRDLYVETMVQAVKFNDDLARKALRRSPSQVLLLHETDLAALFIADLARALRRAGWTIVTADQAYKDPLSSISPDPPSAQGTITEAIAWERGIEEPRWYERSSPRVANSLFEKRVLRSSAKTQRKLRL